MPSKKDETKTKAVAKVNGSVTTMTPQKFKAFLKQEKEKRKMLQEFISQELVEGTDYGLIHMYKKCPHHKEAWNQSKSPKWHFSKKCLFKPGAEKFTSLLHLYPTFRKDDETFEMLPETVKDAGIVCMICELVNRHTGQIESEGRGACAISEKYGIVNNTIKQAEIRAQKDAVLRLGLSDSFTQDIDEPGLRGDNGNTEKSKKPKVNQKINLDKVKVSWGKEHKDKPILKTPSHYLEWTIKEGDFPKEIKELCLHALHKKISIKCTVLIEKLGLDGNAIDKKIRDDNDGRIWSELNLEEKRKLHEWLEGLDKKRGKE